MFINDMVLDVVVSGHSSDEVYFVKSSQRPGYKISENIKFFLWITANEIIPTNLYRFNHHVAFDFLVKIFIY